jgi:hypothetical protein
MTEDNDERACLDHIKPPATAPDEAEGWDIAYRAAAEAKYRDWTPLKEQRCDFRFNPATDSDLIPATVPI